MVKAIANNAVVEVRVAGRGVASELLRMIYEPFQTRITHAKQTTSGLRTGLALVRQWVHLHSGKVDVRSTGNRQVSAFTEQIPSTAAAQPLRSET